MKKKFKGEKCFLVRAYCSDCGKLLMESNLLSKKELMASWDKCVLDAPGIVCQDCDPKRCPNFHITLKIYHRALDKEYDPEKILPKPASAPDLGVDKLMDDYLKSISK